MLMISEKSWSSEFTTLHLEGRVSGLWVIELRRLSENFLAAGRRLILDLAGVSFVDRDGIALFRDLVNRRVTFINPTPFLTEQLKGITSCERFDLIERR